MVFGYGMAVMNILLQFNAIKCASPVVTYGYLLVLQKNVAVYAVVNMEKRALFRKYVKTKRPVHDHDRNGFLPYTTVLRTSAELPM